MAGSNQLVTIAVLGVGGYFVYKWLFATPSVPATPVVTGGGSPTSGGGGTAPATPAAPTGPAFNSLDQIYARVQAAAGPNPLTPDQFNFYLGRELPAGKTPPDPLVIFTQAGFDRTQTMTIANWWGAVAPWLQTNYGLSGLGMFGGLGALALHARRRR